MKKIHSKKAFTLVELLIAILIIAASWSIAATLTPKGQTAKREAQKLQTKLEMSFAQAERKKTKCTILFYKEDPSKILLYWNAEDISEDISTKDCEYKCNKSYYTNIVNGFHRAEIEYKITGATNDPDSMGIKGADGSYRYIILAKTGRLRQDDQPFSWGSWGWDRNW